MSSPAPDISGSILVLARVPGDAEALCQALTRGGHCARRFADVASLTGAVHEESGAVVLTEESLAPPGEAELLAESLRDQPEWSDLPVILLAVQGSNEEGAWALAQGLGTVGNITILERPLRRSTLLNAVGVALHARERQHELRSHLERRAADAKALRESEARFRTMVEAMPQLAWIAHADGSIFWFNQRWHDYTGTSIQEMEGWGWQSVHDPQVLPRVIERWKAALASGQLFEMEFPIRGADGRFRPFLTRAVPLRDAATGEVVQWLGTNTDVSEQKRVREELAAHKERLEAMVQQRTAELQDSLRKLHASERLAAIGTLAAGLGHDIANLVMPIRLRLDLVANSLTKEEARMDVEAIRNALGYLTNVSAGLRLMSLDPERESASTEVDNLAWWWAQAHGVFRGVLPKHVRLEGVIPAGVGVRIPAHRLTQAVFNLVQNAGEALVQQAKGLVRVCASVADDENNPAVEIDVIDDGPGMPPEVVARCFEPYFSTKGRTIATGMGLGMVRGLAESVGGTVAVRSLTGKGTTFTLTLPRSVAPHTQGSEADIPGDISNIAAITISDPRTAGLVRTFLEGLHIAAADFEEGGAPHAAMWIVEDPRQKDVEAYLRQCPGCRVVAVRVEGAIEKAALSGLNRVSVLPASSPPSALRAALILASRGNPAAIAGGEHERHG